MKKALRQSIKEVGIPVINGKPKKVARPLLEQKLPVAILHTVTVGDIGLMTESAILIISLRNFLNIVVIIQMKITMRIWEKHVSYALSTISVS